MNGVLKVDVIAWFRRVFQRTTVRIEFWEMDNHYVVSVDVSAHDCQDHVLRDGQSLCGFGGCFGSWLSGSLSGSGFIVLLQFYCTFSSAVPNCFMEIDVLTGLLTKVIYPFFKEVYIMHYALKDCLFFINFLGGSIIPLFLTPWVCIGFLFF